MENPGLEISFRDSTGEVVASGEVSIWERGQNPTKDSLPLLKRAFMDTSVIFFSPNEVAKAWQEHNERNPLQASDSIFHFNVIVRTAQWKAMETGFFVVKTDKGDSVLVKADRNDTTVQNENQLLEATMVKTPMFESVIGDVGDEGELLGIEQVYIPGSPFHTTVASDGTFVFENIMSGTMLLNGVTRQGTVYHSTTKFNTTTYFEGKSWNAGKRIWIPGDFEIPPF